MTVRILMFGVAKDIVGSSSLELDISGSKNVGSLLSDLKARYPDFQKLNSLLVAVNSEYAEDSHILKEEDEIAIIPPVSGG